MRKKKEAKVTTEATKKGNSVRVLSDKVIVHLTLKNIIFFVFLISLRR